MVLLYFLGLLVVEGALTEAVREVHGLHEESSIAQLADAALRRLGALAGATILVAACMFAVVFGGFLLFAAVAKIVGPLAIPLVLVAVWRFVVPMTRWALVIPVVVVEKASPRQALGRSTVLVRGSGWKVFCTLLLAGLATSFATALVQVVVGLFVGATLAEFAAIVLTAPYVSFVVAAMYFALAEPNAPIVPDRDAPTWQSVWVDKTL
jgi:hypothetical protein